MSDSEELHREGERDVSSDDGTVTQAHEPEVEAEAEVDADVPALVVHDDDSASGMGESDSNSGLELQTGNRLVPDYRQQIRRDSYGDGSELSSVGTGSIDAVPQRAGSNFGSIASGQDEALSVQVNLQMKKVQLPDSANTLRVPCFPLPAVAHCPPSHLVKA